MNLYLFQCWNYVVLWSIKGPTQSDLINTCFSFGLFFEENPTPPVPPSAKQVLFLHRLCNRTSSVFCCSMQHRLQIICLFSQHFLLSSRLKKNGTVQKLQLWQTWGTGQLKGGFGTLQPVFRIRISVGVAQLQNSLDQ